MNAENSRIAALSVGPALVAGPPHISSASRSGPPASGRPAQSSRLWLWVVAACALQIVAWTAWLVIASHNRVAEVPLATAPRVK